MYAKKQRRKTSYKTGVFHLYIFFSSPVRVRWFCTVLSVLPVVVAAFVHSSPRVSDVMIHGWCVCAANTPYARVNILGIGFRSAGEPLEPHARFSTCPTEPTNATMKAFKWPGRTSTPYREGAHAIKNPMFMLKENKRKREREKKVWSAAQTILIL